MRVHGASDHGVVETADTKSYIQLLDLPVGISLPRIFSPIGVHMHPPCCRNRVLPSFQNMPSNVLEGVDNLTFETFAGRSMSALSDARLRVVVEWSPSGLRALAVAAGASTLPGTCLRSEQMQMHTPHPRGGFV